MRYYTLTKTFPMYFKFIYSAVTWCYTLSLPEHVLPGFSRVGKILIRKEINHSRSLTKPSIPSLYTHPLPHTHNKKWLKSLKTLKMQLSKKKGSNKMFKEKILVGIIVLILVVISSGYCLQGSKLKKSSSRLLATNGRKIVARCKVLVASL